MERRRNMEEWIDIRERVADGSGYIEDRGGQGITNREDSNGELARQTVNAGRANSEEKLRIFHGWNRSREPLAEFSDFKIKPRAHSFLFSLSACASCRECCYAKSSALLRAFDEREKTCCSQELLLLRL